MYQCIICRFLIELDDVIAPPAAGRCVCLRCYLRVTETEKPLPFDLFRELRAVPAGA